MYKMIDIKHRIGGETRTDGRYPLRIGSTFNFYLPLKLGECAFLEYVTDNKGNSKDGILRTSLVESYFKDEDTLVFSTVNSVYVMEEIV